jgi:hypothetical protein
MSTVTRTKVVEMDGVKVTIAPMTLEQIEEYIAPLEELEGKTTAKVRVFNLVCNGLNNAMLDENGNMPPDAKPWTHEMLRHRIDMLLYEKLQREILEFSGFKLEDKDVELPGESNAASAKGNSQPVAVGSRKRTSATSAAAS